MQKLTLTVPDTVPAVAGRKLYVELFDTATELASNAESRICDSYRRRPPCSFMGDKTWDKCLKACRQGDDSRVPESDKLLTKFESLSFETHGAHWDNAVSGAMPNVPAFLSGSPMSMRRRVADENEKSPIAIVADLTSSAAISSTILAQRGVAILALVRALAIHRPVELWCGTMLDADSCKNAVALYTRVETAPLDLARACFMLADSGFARRLNHGLSDADYGYQGRWPFDDHKIAQRHMRELIKGAFPHMGDMIAIPCAHLEDHISRNPAEWIESKLREAGVANLQEA